MEGRVEGYMDGQRGLEMWMDTNNPRWLMGRDDAGNVEEGRR